MDVVEVKDISKEEVLMGQHDWSTFQTRFIHNHDLDFIFRFNLEEKYKFTNSIQARIEDSKQERGETG